MAGHGRIHKYILLLPRVCDGACQREEAEVRALQRRAGVVARRGVHADRLARRARAPLARAARRRPAAARALLPLPHRLIAYHYTGRMHESCLAKLL